MIRLASRGIIDMSIGQTGAKMIIRAQEETQRDREKIAPLKPGSYTARLIRIIDLGTQPYEKDEVVNGKKTGRKVPATRKEVLLTFEITNKLIQSGKFEGKPYIVNRRFTASLSEASNLYKSIVSWRGKEAVVDNQIDMTTLLGQAASITTGVTAGGNMKLTQISPLNEEIVAKDAINNLVHLSLNRLEFNPDIFMSLDKWVQQVIMATPEYAHVEDLVGEALPWE